MRVKLEPETAFIGKKFAYIFFGVILVLNLITFIWFFYYQNWSKPNIKFKLDVKKINDFYIFNDEFLSNW